jgi:hypothetical protein
MRWVKLTVDRKDWHCFLDEWQWTQLAVNGWKVKWSTKAELQNNPYSLAWSATKKFPNVEIAQREFRKLTLCSTTSISPYTGQPHYVFTME